MVVSKNLRVCKFCENFAETSPPGIYCKECRLKLAKKLRNKYVLDKLIYKRETYEKTAFWPSDFNKAVLDIYYAFKKVEPTNPPQWYDTLKWGAGRGVEDALITILKDSDVIPADYDQKEHGRIEIEREGIQINGYIDAITKEGFPIEIKSINNKNSWDIKNYEEGKPKENYVGQLSIYMDALGVDTGYLFACTIDGLHQFWIECKKVDERLYKCGNVVVNLDKQYKRWSKLYTKNILEDLEPGAMEFLYKKDVETLDWHTVSKGDISKARNGHKVIGGPDSWRIVYSPWADKIIERQGTQRGYTPKEIEIIKKKTDGYTTWDN